jgi:hypothetical protein
MKDLLGNELEPGDLIADVRTSSYGWKRVGIVHGGVTNGGSVRYVQCSGHKTNTKEKCIIKIDQATFDRLYDEELQKAIQRREDYLERYPNNPNAWYDRWIADLENGYEEIAKLRTEVYQKEFEI